MDIERMVKALPSHELAAIGSRQLARLLRLAGKLNLGREVSRELEAAVLVGADQAFAQQSAPSREWDLKRCELKIRQLVSVDAPWPKIKPLAWQRFRLLGTDEGAARLVETVFVNGTVHEVIDVLAVLNEEGYEYYYRLDRKFRDHLVFSLWKIRKTETLNIFLLQNEPNHVLTSMEWLYLYKHYEVLKDDSKQFMIFKDHREQLFEAIEAYGPRLGIEREGVLFDAGAMAINLGFIKLGEQTLKHIGTHSRYYGDALQLLMVIAGDRDNPAARTYFRQLEETQSWRDRIALLKKYLGSCRSRMGENDIRRPALNEILSQPLKWVPSLPVSWAAISTLIAKNNDLIQVLPGVLNVYRENALKFHTPALDAALWEPMVYEQTVHGPQDQFWRGVALLHQYVNYGKANEETLWKAKADIEEAAAKWAFPLPYSWPDLQQGTLRAVSKSPHLQENRRREMIRQLKIAADPKEISLHEIESYLNESEFQPYPVLQQIQKISQAKGALQLEAQVIYRKSEATHLSNQDLGRLWYLGCQLNDFDLAWRVCTIMEGRGALAAQVQSPWAISGERRTEYAFFQVDRQHVDLCLEGFTGHQKKLCHAMVRIGGLLPELLAALDDGSRQVKFSAPAHDSFEAHVEKILNKTKWLPQPKYVYHFSYDGVLSANIQLPGFVDILPNNLWSYLFVRLGERFGLNAWGWQLSRLHAQVEEILPKLASHSSLNKLSTKVARWLKALTPEQRSAWQDIVTLHNRMSDDEGVETMADFLCRLSMIIHPAHVQALKSLRVMRAPVSIIWKLENWLASPGYSEVRRQFGTFNRVPVPMNLRDKNILQVK